MGEWRPDKQLKVRTPYLGMYGYHAGPFSDNPNVPDYRTFDLHESTTLSMWVVPAPVAGVWRGDLTLQHDQAAVLELVLHQRLGGVTGTFELRGATNAQGGVHADVWGDHLRLECLPEHQPVFHFRLVFDGRVQGNALEGQLAVLQAPEARQQQWTARREEAQLAGCWEWPAADGSGTVSLQIQPDGQRWTATYFDSTQELPVTDCYAFGGGFYFTLLFGREDHEGGGYSLKMDPGCGWILGEGVVIGDRLKGSLSLYPYKPSLRGHSHPVFGTLPVETNSTEEIRTTRVEWKATRTKE